VGSGVARELGTVVLGHVKSWRGHFVYLSRRCWK
jgi:hypothetical protein